MSRTPIPQPFVNQAGWPDAPEAIIVMDSRGIIRLATPAVAAFYGYELEEIIGRSALRFLAPESTEHVGFIWRMFVENEHLRSHEIHATMQSKSGHRIPVRASLWRVPGQDVFLLVHHILDYLRDRLDMLYTLISAMSSTRALDELVDTVLSEVHRVIPCETSTIFMLEADQTVMIRRWKADQIEVERALPSQYLPEFPTSRAMRESGQPLIIYDTATDPRWIDQPGLRPIRSWLGAPLIHRGEYMGEMTLDSTEVNNFDKDDAELAQALAIQVAAALHNVRQFEAEQRRAERFQALSEVSEAINRLELAEVLELVHEKVSGLMDADAFFIGLYDGETRTVRIAGFYDQGQRVPDTVIPDARGLTGIVLRDREAIIVHDSLSDPRVEQAVILGDTPRSLMIMPLITQDEIVGVISVQSYEPYAYPPDDVALLEVIADAVATAVRNAQLYDQTATQLRELRALHQLSLDLAATQAPETIAELTLRTVRDLINPTEARLYLCSNPPWHARAWINRSNSASGAAQFEHINTQEPCKSLRRVFQINEPLILDDLSDAPDKVQQFGISWPVQAAVIYPLKRSDTQIAVLTLLFDRPHTLDQDNRRVIDMLCLQAASALENAHHTVSLTRRLQEVTGLQELARRVSELDSLDAILKTVVNAVRDTLECKSASVALLEPDGETVTLRAGSGLADEHVFGHSFKVGEYVAGAVVERGEVIYVRDTHADSQFRFIAPDIRSLMSVPLTVQRRTIGTLNIDAGTPDAFSKHHERILTIAGGQIAAAIENLRLLKEARKHATELAVANETLAAQDELRRELVFQVSHDLRGPLQIVYGYTDMMREELLGPVTPTQKEVLDLILKRSKSIERMTQDILAARPISRDMLELAPLDLTEVCQQALNDAQMMHRDSRFTFSGSFIPASLPVEADYNRLSRVFDNLIGNAVKFSPEGGTICISTGLDEAQRLALVSISDQGIGIPADKLPYVFERFYRGDRSFRRQFEGAGLGLYIVQQIIAAHQGTIWAESQEGVGSTFTFALPLAER